MGKIMISYGRYEEVGCIPFWLIFHVDLALGVVANIADIREASNIELCCAELRHDGRRCVAMCSLRNVDEPMMRFGWQARAVKCGGQNPLIRLAH